MRETRDAAVALHDLVEQLRPARVEQLVAPPQLRREVDELRKLEAGHVEHVDAIRLHSLQRVDVAWQWDVDGAAAAAWVGHDGVLLQQVAHDVLLDELVEKLDNEGAAAFRACVHVRAQSYETGRELKQTALARQV